jgi:iron complex outermembrane receptor protein
MTTPTFSLGKKTSAILMWVFATAAAVAAEEEQDSATAKSGARSTLEEIIVTAQRREQSLQDVPISVSVITAEDITRNRIDDVGDYLSITPNVSFTAAGTRDEHEIAIRGVANNIGGIDRLDQALGLFVDGFSINLVTNNPQLQDVDRIEVLRGPQGTFFGRGASGGAINIKRKQPGPDFFAEASAEYGRDNTWSAAGTVNIPVVAEKLYLRANGYTAESDGFIENVNPAGGRSGYDYRNFRVATRWLMSDRLTADLALNYTKEDHGIPVLVASGVLGPFGRSIFGPTTPALLEGFDPYPTNTTKINHDLPSRRSNEYYTLTMHLDYELDNLAITSITGYIDRDFNRVSDVDYTSLDFIRQEWEQRDKSFTQELRIASRQAGRWDWLVGGFFASDHPDIPLSRVSVGADNFFGAPPGTVIFLADRGQDSTSWAAFGQLNFRLTDRLTLTAGGRYSADDVEKFDSTAGPDTRSTSFTDFSPHFAVSYNVSNDLMVYGSVSKGYKAGGLQLNPQLPRETFDEEIIWNHEIGLKSEFFGNRLRANAAVFYMDWSDMQVNSQIAIQDPNTGAFVFIRGVGNAAEATSKGFEFDISALPAPNLQLGASAGYLNAKFDKYEDAFLVGGVFDLSGERLPQSPEWTSNAHVHYTRPVRDGMDLFVRGEWNYRSSAVPDVQDHSESGFPFRSPAFNVWNFRLGYVTDRFSVVGFVENAFDEQYFTATSDNGFLSGVGIQPSRRTYGIRVNVHTGE